MDMNGGHTHHPHEPAEADPPARHGMAVVGNGPVFMSHLPMTHRPHNYQVILNVTLGSLDSAYLDDRKAHPEARLYTFAPEPFVLPDLFPGKTGEPARRSFTGSLFRNHFEQPPAHPETPFEISSDVTVDVVDVIVHNRFASDTRQPEELMYILFGRGQERFLAHRITGPFTRTNRKEFDHLLAIDLKGPQISDDQLRQGVEVTVTGRSNQPGAKLRETEKVAAVAVVDGHNVPVEIDVRSEEYFETDDLTPDPH
ncbi:hypothetical protein GCM10010503_40120 [Streptomyces lucensis JCM 4490]|uniref:Uncharacterized protein n=1 Tax=Streptomyces lucensis JCM 4490 TaxID=1306176 RepID=A0A918MRH5_9ACTN|nr:hypothetical protein [Streptomyces lucensis]GGW58975.1 hypothetical protein GCM10010503_40120 [Streptomyces lucensis JCM 4490]